MKNRSFSPEKGTKQSGFSLIELIIVVTILGVLSSVAITIYREFVVEGCRTDAMIALEKVANEQSQYYWDNNRYASVATLLPVPATSPKGYCALTSNRIGGDTNTFRANATQSGGECLPKNDFKFRILHTGLRERKPNSGNWVQGWDE